MNFEIFKLPYSRFNQSQIDVINNDILQSYEYFARNQSLETRDKYIVVAANGHDDHGVNVYYLNVYHNGVKLVDDIPNVPYSARNHETIDLRSTTRVVSNNSSSDSDSVGRISIDSNNLSSGMVASASRTTASASNSSSSTPTRTRDEHIAFIRAEYLRTQNNTATT